jgi:hypothetical protein
MVRVELDAAVVVEVAVTVVVKVTVVVTVVEVESAVVTVVVVVAVDMGVVFKLQVDSRSKYWVFAAPLVTMMSSVGAASIKLHRLIAEWSRVL